MKRPMHVFLSLLAVSVLWVPAALAQSASGGFKVVTEEGTTTFDFDAVNDARGNASGTIKFSGPITVPDQDVDGDKTGDPSTKGTILNLGISVDCLQVVRNRAVLSGVVKDSTVREYAGRRILLTVEQGAGTKEDPHSYTWGQYRPTVPTWVASDAELKEDPGVGMRWWASDYEVKDDPGFQMGNPPTEVTCKSFSLSSYDLDPLAEGSGSIVIKPAG